jgi:hypothetical protein
LFKRDFMKKVIKNFNLDKVEYYLKHLEIVNICLPKEIRMAKKEILVLANFMALDKNITEEDMFNVYSRKLVKEKLKIGSAGLTNYIAKLVLKGIIDRNELTNKLKIKPQFLIGDNSQEYVLKIIRKHED